MTVTNQKILDYEKYSRSIRPTTKYKNERRYHPASSPHIDMSNPSNEILKNHMWALFRDLINITSYQTLINMLHDPYCPSCGLLPKDIDTARNYTYRYFKSSWYKNRSHYLFGIIERYYFPELMTKCEACGRPGEVVYHHWVEPDGNKGEAFICKDCNSYLTPQKFGYNKSHLLPDFETQKKFVLEHYQKYGISY